MKITLIAAVSQNGVIGKNNQIPWHLPADFKYFKANTLHKPVIMGRKTFESLPYPLPSRLNVIVSRTLEKMEHVDCCVFKTLQDAFNVLSGYDEVMIAGGARLYAEALPLATHLRITHVHATVEGDIFFPAIDWKEWHCIETIEHPADEKNQFAMTFCLYEREKCQHI